MKDTTIANVSDGVGPGAEGEVGSRCVDERSKVGTTATSNANDYDQRNVTPPLRSGVGYVLNLFTNSGRRIDITGEECRRYGAILNVRGHLGRAPVFNRKPIVYEVRYRDVVTHAPGKRYTVDMNLWRQFVCGGDGFIDGGYTMATPYIVELESFRPKNAFQADWRTFNFDGIVHALGAMMALTTVSGDVSTKDLRQKGDTVHIAGYVEEGDIRAISDNAVFIPHSVGYFGSGRAYPALIHATHLAGGKIVTDYLPLMREGRPCVIELQGGALMESICEALGVLANVYQAAGRGDVYALALVKGIHTVLTVVGHSDEGGFMRDVLRVGRYTPPWGGIPTRVHPWCGFSLVSEYDREGIEAWVDQIAIVSAAAVAHCDPHLTVSGKILPTVFQTSELGETGDPATPEEKAAEARAKILKNFNTFSALYVRALAKCLGFPSEVDSSVHSAAHQLFAMCENLGYSRHLCYDVVAPYFWVEPTGILPSNAFGYEAENRGTGSLCGPGELRTMPFLRGAAPTEAVTDQYTQLEVPFDRLRDCGLVLLCQGSSRDGMAQAYLTQFEPGSLMLSRTPGEGLSTALSAHELGVPLCDVAWTRGQSAIPHPAEGLHLDPYVLMTLVHCRGSFTSLEYFDNIPEPGMVTNATIDIWVTKPRRLSNGLANTESRSVQRYRNRAVRAISSALNMINSAVRVRAYHQCARSGTYIPKQIDITTRETRLKDAFRATEDQKTVEEHPARMAPVDALGSQSMGSGSGPVPSRQHSSAGKCLAPTRVHASLAAPQPQREVEGQTIMPPPIDLRSLGGAGGSMVEQANPSSGVQVSPGAAQMVAGAAPGGN
nr:MAG: putative coat protein [Totiviridae sp.]